MVELDIQSGINSNGLVGDTQKKSVKQLAAENGTNDSDASEDIDFGLIKEVRNTLEELYETDGDNFAELHYKQIMDKKSPFTCWRYLIHTNKQVNDAVELIKQTLEWRKEHDVDGLSNEQSIKEFWHYSPIAFTGVTKDGQHDVLYTIGKNYRKPDALMRPIIKRFCSNLLFGFDRKHLHDLRKFVVVFDVSDTGIRNIDLDFMKWLVGIRDFIPARIHEIYVIGIPLLVRPLIRLIISWLPEKFSNIVHCGTFEQLVLANIDLDSLPMEVGGNRDESYRLAPQEAPWQADSAIFSDSQMDRAIEETIGFSVNAERRDILHALQLEYDDKILKTGSTITGTKEFVSAMV